MRNWTWILKIEAEGWRNLRRTNLRTNLKVEIRERIWSLKLEGWRQRTNLKIEGEIKEGIWRLKNIRRWNQNEDESKQTKVKTNLNRNERRLNGEARNGEGWTDESTEKLRHDGEARDFGMSFVDTSFVWIFGNEYFFFLWNEILEIKWVLSEFLFMKWWILIFN